MKISEISPLQLASALKKYSYYLTGNSCDIYRIDWKTGQVWVLLDLGSPWQVTLDPRSFDWVPFSPDIAREIQGNPPFVAQLKMTTYKIGPL